MKKNQKQNMRTWRNYVPGHYTCFKCSTEKKIQNKQKKLKIFQNKCRNETKLQTNRKNWKLFPKQGIRLKKNPKHMEKKR